MDQRKVEADNDPYIFCFCFCFFPFLLLLNQCFQRPLLESRDRDGQDTSATRVYPHYLGPKKHGHVTNCPRFPEKGGHREMFHVVSFDLKSKYGPRNKEPYRTDSNRFFVGDFKGQIWGGVNPSEKPHIYPWDLSLGYPRQKDT